MLTRPKQDNHLNRKIGKAIFTTFFFSYLYLISLPAIAQVTFHGKVTDSKGEPLSYATILLKSVSKGGQASANGEFRIDNIPAGEHEVEISFIGYQSHSSKILFEGKTVKKNFVLKATSQALDAVEIRAETEAEEMKRSGYSVALIKSAEFKNVSPDINQVIKALPGVNVRETGGLGSSFNLSLNGLSGNQVRYFIDGVPMENYGSALTLNNFPVTLIENVEVYKGVVPIKFGADALGGAINIVTDNSPGTLLDASYSVGSFNTHRVAFNGKYAPADKGYFVKLHSFLNYSDNSYDMQNVPIEDELGNLKEQDAERFHSAYTSAMINAKAGLTGKIWADEFSIGYLHAQNHREYQHQDLFITKAFKDFHGENSSDLATLNYRKNIGKLFFSAYANGGVVKDTYVDTSSVEVNWRNEIIDSNADGEFFENKRLYTVTDRIFRANQFVSYDLGDLHQLQANFSQNYMRRKGHDDVDPFNTAFNDPSHISKSVLGVAYRIHNPANTLNAEIFGKQYWYSGETRYTETGEAKTVKSDANPTGFGLTTGWTATDDLGFRFSFEKAYRLPEGYELLGDGLFINISPELQPEKSYNYNLEADYAFELSRFQFKIAVNGFWRESSNLIRLLAPNPRDTRYVNLSAVRAKGIESSLTVSFDKHLTFSGNLTNQSLNVRDSEAKVPNEPLLFGNASLRWNILPNVSDKDLSVQWQFYYTDKIYMAQVYHGSQGKKIIPTQKYHSASIDYAFASGKYNVALMANNVLDALVYDNFRVQKPGRAFYLKLRYVFEKE
ncbi:TonB-dependent receptor (plasmid) [Fulvitalea axinellae]|uniref:TonB-dependent receptor n=1 Tax=Fulvitalea axinellae TaxID=1182444 RepID=A0AAU9CX59_9BACT|nr:TonB-dependent receptor [Fulvitalea axinellae]